MTELDDAHKAMEAAPDDDRLRLRFFERLADTELFLLLEKEAEGDQITPEAFDVEGTAYLLVFDRVERLSEFTGQVSPHVALSGRVLASMVARQDLGLALNPDVAPSAMLLPSEGVAWLAEMLDTAPGTGEARLLEVAPPGQLPETLLEALDRKLATARGFARVAYLTMANWQGGTKGHLLVFVGAPQVAQMALANAVSEALTFSGLEAGALDVAFRDVGDPAIERLERVGLRFDLPELSRETNGPGAPGMDPSKPPKLT